jgi:hypothetical protein
VVLGSQKAATRDLDRLFDVATRLRLKRVGLAIDDLAQGIRHWHSCAMYLSMN